MGDMVTAKFHDSEISKSVDFNYSASSSIATLHALFDGMFNDVVNSFVVSGMVPIAAVPPSMNVVVPPGLAYSRVEDKLLHLGSNITVSVAAADPSLSRIDTLEMRYFETELDLESRAFKDPTTGDISYSSVYTKVKSSVEVRCLEGVPGAGVAPDTEVGYMKLAEIVIPAGATEILGANIRAITAQEDGAVNSSWTAEQAFSFALGSVESIKNSIIAHKNNNITSSNTVHGIRQGSENGFDADMVDGYHHNQSLLVESAPRFARLGIGMAADAGRVLSVTGDGYISGNLAIGITDSDGYTMRVHGSTAAVLYLTSGASSPRLQMDGNSPRIQLHHNTVLKGCIWANTSYLAIGPGSEANSVFFDGENVSIGTITPGGNKLRVNGTVRIDDTLYLGPTSFIKDQLGTYGSIVVGGYGGTNTSYVGIQIDTGNTNHKPTLMFQATGSGGIYDQGTPARWILYYNKAANSYTFGGSSTATGTVYTAALYGAVGNDFADKLNVEHDGTAPGYVVEYTGNKMRKAGKLSSRAAIGIVTDTASITAGDPNCDGLSIAVAGFVLAYVDRHYKTGTRLTRTKHGTLTRAKLWSKVLAVYIDDVKTERWNSVLVNGRRLVKVV